jgi:hypothetical protein
MLANVRGQGLMIGFDVVPPQPEKAADFAAGFMFGCRRRGVHLTYGYGSGNCRIIPPLVITKAEIDFACEVIETCLNEANAGLLKDSWPTNPYTRALFEKHPFRRVLNYWWHSSPAELLEKSRDLVQQRFGGRR